MLSLWVIVLVLLVLFFVIVLIVLLLMYNSNCNDATDYRHICLIYIKVDKNDYSTMDVDDAHHSNCAFTSTVLEGSDVGNIDYNAIVDTIFNVVVVLSVLIAATV